MVARSAGVEILEGPAAAEEPGWSGPLGVLQLQNEPMTFVGCLGNPETFDFPILCRKVEGAWVENVVPGDPAVEPAFVAAAEALAAQGAIAITSNCGFALRYQRAVAASVPVPVSLSSLLLLPLLLAATPQKRRIGVVTFDSRHFTSDLLMLAGVRDTERVVPVGIEESGSWEAMSRREVRVDYDALEADVTRAVGGLLTCAPGIALLLFECAGFGPFAPAIRHDTRLPVYDAQSNARLLMCGYSSRP